MIVLGIDAGQTIGICVLDYPKLASPRALYVDSFRDESGNIAISCIEVGKRYDLDVVSIEAPETIYPRKGFGTKMATNLGHARDVAGEYRGRYELSARFRDGVLKIVQVTAEEARYCCLGDKAAPDDLIARRIPQLIRDWPARSNNHERDAAVTALFGNQTVYLETMGFKRKKFRR